MKKTIGIILAILITVVIMLLVFIGLLLTGIVNINIDNKIKETNNNIINNEPKKDILFDITYMEEEYNTKSDDGKIVTNNKRNIPVIVSKDRPEVANKIVSYLTKESDEFWNSNVKPMADQMIETNIQTDLLGVTHMFSTNLINEYIISFQLKTDGSFGGVSWNSISGYNFDAQTGELLSLNDIMSNADDFIANECKDDIITIAKSSEKELNENWENEFKNHIINNTKGYYLKKDGISIVFNKYEMEEILGFLYGFYNINIPKENINNYLKEEYRIK